MATNLQDVPGENSYEFLCTLAGQKNLLVGLASTLFIQDHKRTWHFTDNMNRKRSACPEKLTISMIGGEAERETRERQEKG